MRLEIRLSAKREKLFFETAFPLIDTGGRRDHIFFVLFTGFLSYCSVKSTRCATRGPQIQRVLAHAPTACVTRVNSDEVVELFDGGWLPLGEGLPRIRVIVARHPAPPLGKSVTVGKRIDEWVYELFLTDLDADGFLAEDILDLYHGRGAFEAVLADEDVEEDPDRWCSCTECGQELWQIACQ